MNITIQPGRLRGSITAPPSKSAAHRAAICASLADGVSRISGIDLTKDMEATIGAVSAMGAECTLDGTQLAIRGIFPQSSPNTAPIINCNESGSTLRFMVPIAAALGRNTGFTGQGKLPQRPMTPLTEALQAHGIEVTYPAGQILALAGQLRHGIFSIQGDVSSQYITGLLFALPLLQEDSEIRLISPLQSRGYVDLTLQMQKRFGILVEKTAEGFQIPGNQGYRPCDVLVEGDYSAAAFWLCAGAVAGDVSVSGLDLQSLQGDRAVVSILKQMGASADNTESSIRVSSTGIKGMELDVADIPDLVPVLAAAASTASGSTVLYNAGRLRIKESNRLQTVTAGLQAMGANIREYPDKLVIQGKPVLPGGCQVDSFRDHRIPMAMTVAALRCEQPVTIIGAECVDKSYPSFFRDFKALGGIAHVV